LIATPGGRVEFIADSWMLAEAGRKKVEPNEEV
jgi:hypothetical protein